MTKIISCLGSSVVERFHGKEEVESSTLSPGSIKRNSRLIRIFSIDPRTYPNIIRICTLWNVKKKL